MSNRLAHESSPYLLQHKDNPVDWYPWGEKAFRRAKEEDKPIFLSIGYATCHWCHVMEHESFEDEEVARLLNETFVCIKVDREERPDIDQVYMTVCQMVTGQGGWPLTILMTPDQQPFYAATYIPRQSRFNRIGMVDLVPRIGVAWRQDRAQIEDSAGQVSGSLRQVERASMAGAEPSEEWLQLTVKQLRQQYDEQEGGFGRAPKFPSPHKLLFLLRYWKSTNQQEALDMVRHTLVQMRQGGVFDHVGYGFHRYSTDAHWRLPHFEKMLYDQAMLVMAYTEAYHATGEAAFRETAEEVITYVLRDLTAPDGGFYSAEDADSEGREGAFYVWTEDELESVLGEDTGFAARVFNVDPSGNFADEATGQKTGENILFLTDTVETMAEREGMSIDAFRQRLEQVRQTLLAHRAQRERPLLDDKILTDWNGLMIAGLAQAARVFGDATYRQAAERAAAFITYRQAAERAAAFILGTLRTDEGRLLHRYRAGQAGLQANLDDYAFLVWGLLELYETTFDVTYLQQAVALNEQMLAHFEDAERGGFYFPPDDGEALLIRSKEAYDGAIPSGNSIAMYNLIRLSRLLARPGYEEAAWRTAAAFGEAARRQPSGFCAMMMALGFATGAAQEIVIAGRAEAADTRALLDVVRTTYQPHKVVVLRPEGAGQLEALVDLIPLVQDQKPIDGSATAYVCENYRCQAPTTEPDVLHRRLTTE